MSLIPKFYEPSLSVLPLFLRFQVQKHTLIANYPQFSLAYFGKNPAFYHLYLRNLQEITNFAVSKDGRFERAETVKIGGANSSNNRFVF